LKDGFKIACELGYTHVFQVDADGQHDITSTPTFLEAGRAQPEALVLAYPTYDDSAPKSRLVARKITRFWVNLEVGRERIVDALIGFRVYPLASALATRTRGNRMDFDVEIAVHMARAGVPIINLPVKVHYPSAEHGGISHFRPLRDNLRLFWLHCRLITRGINGWFLRLLRIRR
jgi:hypothetical protein